MSTTTPKESLGKALGRISSGLYVLTTGFGDKRQGILASWVMQSSFEPPTLTVALAQDREILATLKEHRKFVINVLAEGDNSLLGRFAKYRPDQFDGLEMIDQSHGIILQDAVSYLCCELKGEVPAGDHLVLVGEIIEGEMLNEDLQPRVHTRKNGFSY